MSNVCRFPSGGTAYIHVLEETILAIENSRQFVDTNPDVLLDGLRKAIQESKEEIATITLSQRNALKDYLARLDVFIKEASE